eukprot:Mrub_09784.p1 GENE.Mrub_09784~~Mrub_09784.p1  ORF type:complete len:225 (-),score=29.62 Mrub_09784:51-638(-)
MYEDIPKYTAPSVKDETKYAYRIVRYYESIFDFLDKDANDKISDEELKTLIDKYDLKQLYRGKTVIEICNQLIQTFGENSSDLTFVNFVKMFEKQLWKDIQENYFLEEKNLVDEAYIVGKRFFYYLSNNTDKILLENRERLMSEINRYFGIEIPDKFYNEMLKFDLDADGQMAIEEFEASLLNGLYNDLIIMSVA